MYLPDLIAVTDSKFLTAAVVLAFAVILYAIFEDDRRP